MVSGARKGNGGLEPEGEKDGLWASATPGVDAGGCFADGLSFGSCKGSRGVTGSRNGGRLGHSRLRRRELRAL